MIILPTTVCECKPQEEMRENIVSLMFSDECVESCPEKEAIIEIQEIPPSLCPCPIEDPINYKEPVPAVTEEVISCFDSLIKSIPTTKLCSPNGPKCVPHA